MSENDNLADKVISNINRPVPANDEYKNQWGMDEFGFPWPNPVTTDAVVAAILLKYNKEDMFKINGDLFFDRRKYTQNRQNLLALCGKPKIVVWANESEERRDPEVLWAQVKRVVNSDWPVIWVKLREIIPEYDRDYIRIKDDMIWGKEESDILIG